MPSDTSKAQKPSSVGWRNICQTLSSSHAGTDDLLARLEYAADLLANTGPLPKGPLLLWRETSQRAQYKEIGRELVVGRDTGESGLPLPEDKLLSRRHFIVRLEGETCALEDLKSSNGTAVNRTENRIQRQTLRDGDLILAGNHTFIFLNQGQIV